MELKTLINRLVAINEAEKDEKEKDDKKAENEDVDKRKLIDEVGGILKDKVDEELWRTIIGKIEKLAYDKSSADTGLTYIKKAAPTDVIGGFIPYNPIQTVFGDNAI